jgi:ppGpp synthetase/RelA/SpoT-type nucleotidyltranferase
MSTPETDHAREPAQGPVREAVRAYAARQPALAPVTEAYVAMIRTLLDDAGIDYLSVTGRTKSVASFAAKATRADAEGQPVYADPLEEVTDQIGVRVITYVHSDVAAVAELLAEEFRVLDDRDWGAETAQAGRFGYASRHLLVVLDPEPGSAYDDLAGHRASIQVRTVLQHAWAEFEHDIRYKGTVPAEFAPELDRRFTLAAGLLELADKEFSTIREIIAAAAPSQDEATRGEGDHGQVTGQELATFLAGHYTDAGWSHTDHYDWIAGLLAELGITSLDDLAGLLSSVDAEAVIRHMGYRYPAGAVRRLDDALLAIFGEQYVALEGNSHRVPKLRARLEKLTGEETAG